MYLVLYAVLPSWSVALGFIALLVIGTVGLLWWASGDGAAPLDTKLPSFCLIVFGSAFYRPHRTSTL
jgi:hypothetical protein